MRICLTIFWYCCCCCRRWCCRLNRSIFFPLDCRNIFFFSSNLSGIWIFTEEKRVLYELKHVDLYTHAKWIVWSLLCCFTNAYIGFHFLIIIIIIIIDNHINRKSLCFVAISYCCSSCNIDNISPAIHFFLTHFFSLNFLFSFIRRPMERYDLKLS